MIDGMLSAGPLKLQVVYPVNNQVLPAVDSTFILGSVEPGSKLSINGENVKVHKDGGWLAFLPVAPGPFTFRLRGSKNKDVDTLTLHVRLPELPRYSLDSLYIVKSSMEPSQPTEVGEGSLVALSFSGTPYCNAFGVVLPTGDTIPMREASAKSYYVQNKVFDRNSNKSSETEPESLLIRGNYEGSFYAPHMAGDSLRLVYHIYPPSNDQIDWYERHSLGKGGKAALQKLQRLTAIRAETTLVTIGVMHDLSPRIVELKDSVTVIRTGPGKGYQCLFQPAGVRAEYAGHKGSWIRLKLAQNQDGWVPDTSMILLPPGTPVPHSFIRQIQTTSYANYTTITIGTTARHPFQVEEDLNAGVLTVLFFGADADTDWIRYDSKDSLISRIEWSQAQTGIYRVRIYMTSENIWGYDAHYVGNEFRLDIKKYPAGQPRLAHCRIVVDPGHSPDPGATGPTGLKEKDANLNIAKQLKKELEREGADVILTRSDDSPLPLYDRPKMAVKEKADLFISIHNNALPDGINPFVNNGVSTYYFQPHSAALARFVQKSLAAELETNDFGWYYSNLAVDRPTQYPAILVECTFMMIPEQEAILKTEKFQKRVAGAIADGIKDFLRYKAAAGHRN